MKYFYIGYEEPFAANSSGVPRIWYVLIILGKLQLGSRIKEGKIDQYTQKKAKKSTQDSCRQACLLLYHWATIEYSAQNLMKLNLLLFL